MRKISCVTISVLILFSLFSFTTLAENTVAYEIDFSNGVSVPTSFSDSPTGFDSSPHTKFKNENGVFVFDTQPQIDIETEYPYKTTTTPTYSRVNYDFADYDAKVGKYLYQSKVSFSRNFSQTSFTIRYGAAAWINGTTFDETLYEVTADGKLKFGTYQLQLTLDTAYNIAVLVDLFNDPVNYKSLYINGIWVSQNQATSIGGSGGATPSKAFYASHVLKPYNSPYPFTYRDVRLSLDDIKITKITDEYSVFGDGSFYIPRANQDEYHQYTFKDMFGNDVMPDWSVLPADTGVSIDSAGLVTVTPTATAGNYTIRATYDEVQHDKTVAVNQFVYIYEVIGDDAIVIKQGDGTKPYTYICQNQLSEPYAATFSVTPSVSGMTIDSSGVLTVPENTPDANYTITAKNASGTVLAEKIVSISHLTYTITGEDQIYYPADGSLTQVKYRIKDNLGNTFDNGVFSLVGNPIGITVFPDGRVYLDKTVTASGFAISATKDGAVINKTVALQKGAFYDFENDGVGGTPASWENNAKVAVLDNNKFLNALSGAQGRIYFKSGSIKISLATNNTTFKFRSMVTSENTASPNLLNLSSATKGTDLSAWYFILPTSKSGNTATIKTSTNASGANVQTTIATVDVDKWFDIKTEFDFVNKKFDLFIDNNLVCDDFLLPTDMKDFKIDGIIATCAIDDVSIFSGFELPRTIEIKNNTNVFLPDAGTTRVVDLKSIVKVNGVEATGTPVEWSLVSPHDGVSIAGNKLTVSSGATGSFPVAAKISGTKVSDTKQFTLVIPDVFPSVSGSTLNITTDPNTQVGVTVFGNKDTSTLIKRLGEDFWETPVFSTSVTTNASGKATYSLSGLQAGRYIVYVSKQGGAAIDIPYISNPTELINDVDAMADDKFVEFMSEFSDVPYQTILDAYHIAKTSPNRALTAKLANKDFNHYYLAVLLTTLYDKQAIDTTLVDKTIAELTENSLRTYPVSLIKKVTNYTEALKAVVNSTSISDYLDKLYEKETLYEIKNCVNVRDPKLFLTELGNTKYNNATDTQKNYICELVANKEYNSLIELNNAINALVLPEPERGGGGGGTGGVTSGTISGGYMGQPVAPKAPLFTDVPESHWAFSSVEKLYSLDIAAGYNGFYRPGDKITRAELVKMLVKAFGVTGSQETIFADVNAGDWYYDYVNIAAAKNLVTGYDNKFFPNENVTRQDAIVMIYRFADFSGYRLQSKEISFSDNQEISDYALTAMKASLGSEIISGYEDNTIRPKNNLTRAETAKIIFSSLKIGG